MATNEGEERKGEAVTAILRARSVAGFAIVHGAVALFLFLVLEGVDQCAEPFNQVSQPAESNLVLVQSSSCTDELNRPAATISLLDDLISLRVRVLTFVPLLVFLW